MTRIKQAAPPVLAVALIIIVLLAFAAFTVTWHDTRNGTGLFEPVGTGAQYRRRGLGRALLARGMHLMRAAGLRTALVAYEEDNPASGALYRSMGFEPTWTLHDYRKPWEPAAAG